MFEYLLRRIGLKKKPQPQPQNNEKDVEVTHESKTTVRSNSLTKPSFTTRLPPNPRPAPPARPTNSRVPTSQPTSGRRIETGDTPITQNDNLAWSFAVSQSSEPTRESSCTSRDTSSYSESTSSSCSDSSSSSYSGE